MDVFDELSSFPISIGFDNRFLITFTAPNKNGNHCIRLYDTDLNLIKVLHKTTLIESAFMNESYIIIFYAKIVNECCHVYNHNLDELFTFGQQINRDNDFFMEKSLLTRQVT